jgi:hypothetical protein
LDHVFSNYDEEKTNEMYFQNKPYILNINLAPTRFGPAGAPSSRSPKDPDKMVRMLRHKCQINEGRESITVCMLSAEGTECDNTQTVSTPY